MSSVPTLITYNGRERGRQDGTIYLHTYNAHHVNGMIGPLGGRGVGGRRRRRPFRRRAIRTTTPCTNRIVPVPKKPKHRTFRAGGQYALGGPVVEEDVNSM